MRRPVLLIASSLVLAACNRAPAPSASVPEAVPSTPAPAAVTAPVAAAPATAQADAGAEPQQPAPMPEGSFASYQCDDGTQVEVHFNGIAATVLWPDGRRAQLSQSTTAAAGAPQVYSDRRLRIERAADGLHLRDGDAAETMCTETEASA